MNNSQSTARIENSFKLPDYFSCQNCLAWKYGNSDKCNEFYQTGRCAKFMLGEALRSGAVQIMLYLPNEVRQ